MRKNALPRLRLQPLFQLPRTMISSFFPRLILGCAFFLWLAPGGWAGEAPPLDAAELIDELAALPAAGATSRTARLRIQTLTEELEFIEEWYICGPFPHQGSAPLEKRWATRAVSAAPEAAAFFGETYRRTTDTVGWSSRKIEDAVMLSTDPVTKKIRGLDVRIIDFLKAFPQSLNRSAYALAFVDAPTTQTRTMLAGSDDGIAIWLNGRRIHQKLKARPIVPDEDFAIAKFRQGLNVLLVKVENDRGYWGFMLRLRSPKSRLKLPADPLLDAILN